jgi:hypothetical protein
MACDTQAVIDEANCLRCSVPPGLVGYVALAIMCAIRDGDTSMACDPATLMEEARCLQCSIPQGMLGFAQLAVLCDIASGGGGGGGGQVMAYDGPDPTTDGLVPTDPTQPAIAYKRDGTLPQFSWDTNTATWV